MTSRPCVLGIFVGGAAKRMGGVSKALLRTPDGAESLVERMTRVGVDARLHVVIVGTGDIGQSLAQLPRLVDAPVGVGPLGGLHALLTYAQQRRALALAVGCDMPYVSSNLLTRLASDPRPADVLCPLAADGGKWQPLFARYEPARVLPHLAQALAAGERSFQALLARCDTQALALDTKEAAELRDWDTPEDVTSP